jgi:hypothetical protein
MYALLVVAAILNQSELPPAKEVVRSAVEVVMQSRAEMERRGITYHKKKDVFDTSSTPPQRKDEAVWLMWYEQGASRQKLIEKNGEPVANAREENPGPDALARLSVLYDYSWDSRPIQSSEGTDYYVIRFKPHKKKFRTKTRQEKVLARMVGVMYIEIKGRYVAGLFAELPESFRFGWGVGKVNRVSFLFRQREISGLVVFDEIIADFSYAVFGIQVDERHRYVYCDYQPREEEKPPDR